MVSAQPFVGGTKASDLIKRFQSHVDANNEKPIIPTSNSFGTPGAAAKRTPSWSNRGLAEDQPSPSISPTALKTNAPEVPPKDVPTKDTLAEDNAADDNSSKHPDVIDAPESTSEQPTLADIAKQSDGRMHGAAAPDGKLPIYLRSAGLSAPPKPMKEQSDDSRANNAQPREAISFSTPSTSQIIAKDLPPIVTSPYHDHDEDNVPVPEPVPGSAALLASPSQSSLHAITYDHFNGGSCHGRSLSVESISGANSPHGRHGRSLSVDSCGSTNHEGLSQPSSPAADGRRLSVPPLRNDSSPPPILGRSGGVTTDSDFVSGPLEMGASDALNESPGRKGDVSPPAFELKVPDAPEEKQQEPGSSNSTMPSHKEVKLHGSKAELASAMTKSASANASPSASPKLGSNASSTTRASHSLSNPTASSLAKTRSKAANGSGHNAAANNHGTSVDRRSTSTSSSPSRSPTRMRTSTRGPASARMSPTTSRGSENGTTGGSPSSSFKQSPSSSSLEPRKRSPVVTRPSSLVNANTNSSNNSGNSPSSSSPSPSSRAVQRSTSTSPTASRASSVSAVPGTTKHGALAGSDQSGDKPKSGTASSSSSSREGKPMRMATRGRIGLAGAHMNRQATSAKSSAPAPVAGDLTSTDEHQIELEQNDALSRSDQPESGSLETVDRERFPEAEGKGQGEKVFKGFGSARPHGRIPIPMQQDSEGRMRPVGAQEFDQLDLDQQEPACPNEGATIGNRDQNID